MSLALTSIFSFVVGLLVAGMLAHWGLTLIRGKFAGAFIGGVVRGLWFKGLPRVVVKTIAHGDVEVDTLDLASALESTVRDFMEPPDAGGGIEEPA